VAPYLGQCLCGAVRYRVHREPLAVYACHCTDCQRRTGSAFAMSMIVRPEDLELVAGETTSYLARLPDGRTKSGQMCLACGTRLWGTPVKHPEIRIVQPGTLDQPVGLLRRCISGSARRSRGSHFRPAFRRTTGTLPILATMFACGEKGQPHERQRHQGRPARHRLHRGRLGDEESRHVRADRSPGSNVPPPHSTRTTKSASTCWPARFDTRSAPRHAT
jgi:hypothetical protein